MPNCETDKKIQSIESILYKILEELSNSKEVNGKLFEELEYINKQLLDSLNNEKKLLLLKQKQEKKIEELDKEIQNQRDKIQSQSIKNKELERKYDKLKKSKVVRFTYKYWDLRKKIGLRGK